MRVACASMSLMIVADEESRGLQEFSYSRGAYDETVVRHSHDRPQAAQISAAPQTETGLRGRRRSSSWPGRGQRLPPHQKGRRTRRSSHVLSYGTTVMASRVRRTGEDQRRLDHLAGDGSVSASTAWDE